MSQIPIDTDSTSHSITMSSYGTFESSGASSRAASSLYNRDGSVSAYSTNSLRSGATSNTSLRVSTSNYGDILPRCSLKTLVIRTNPAGTATGHHTHTLLPYSLKSQAISQASHMLLPWLKRLPCHLHYGYSESRPRPKQTQALSKDPAGDFWTMSDRQLWA